MPPNSVLDALVDALGERLQARYKHTSPSGTPSNPYYQGPGGLFGVDGLERDIISTRIHPRGLASALPARGSIVTNPLYPYLTGFQSDSGSNPDGVCDDGPVAGPGKSCIQTAQFGLYTQMTREMDVTQPGRQADRGMFLDLRILNDPLLANPGGITSPTAPSSPDLRRETLMRFMEVGVSLQNRLIQQLYVGNPANNSAGGGYREFPGLDILISTNKVDAITGTNCPSLDSDIKDFNYVKVDHDGGTTLVNVLTYLLRYLKHNAEGSKLNPVTWKIVMREELFYELTAVWPCSYLTYRCQPNSNAAPSLNIDSGDAIALRDSMRQDKYLIIDGQRYDVVIDDGIVEESATDNGNITQGCFASDIYVIPTVVRGGILSTYWEYLDYSKTAMVEVGDGSLGDFFWSDGGIWLWHKKPPTNWCVQWITRIEPRVILLTPQLAGRLQNVQYCPLQHTRQPFNTDDYFVNGGVTTARQGPSLYSDWNLPA